MAMVGFAGMPRVSIVGGFRRRDAANVAFAKCARRRRDLLLQRIGAECGQERAAARQDAKQRAESRSAKDRGHGEAQVLPSRPDAADGGRHRAFAFLLFKICGAFGDSVDRHRQGDEFHAVGQSLKAEVETADAGVHVGPRQTKQ
jgi:hypothetical protein